jgi:hypothetical protein
MATVEEWNAALLDLLLPKRQTEGPFSVLLSCDDLAVEHAAARLGIREDAVTALAECLKGAYEITFEGGVRGIVDHGRHWRRLSRPRPLPSFVAGLALAVVAASRMDRNENVSTNAYYTRLCDIFDIPKRDEWPGVASFETLMTFFADLQDWLAVEEGGRRGALVLREPPRNLSVVGVAIGQTPLRGRDRALLGRFFRSTRPALEAGHDPVRLLRRWGYASMLTTPMREKLEDSELEDVMRAALLSAMTAWDGAVLDEDGYCHLDADLYLRIMGPRVALRLVVLGLDDDAAADGPDGPLVLPGGGQEFGVPLTWLEKATLGPVSISLTHRRARVSVLPGTTALFEGSDAGLRRVPAATSETVAVLTCDATLLANAQEDGMSGPPLPHGWQLAFGVDPDDLPTHLRSAEPADDAEEVRLVGGLPLNFGAYLADYPPALLSELGEPARVEVDGVECGEALPGAPFDLRPAVTDRGVYHVAVGDVWEQTIELAEHGPRTGTDAYQWLPAGPVWAKASAMSQCHGDEDGPKVRGATIINDGNEHPWRPSLLTRHQDLVDVIFRDGTWTTCGPPLEDGWHRRMGIGTGEPWELPRPADIAYALLRGRHAQIVCYADVYVEPSESLLDLIASYENGEVADRTADKSGATAWGRLMDRAIYESSDAQA